MQLGQNRRLHGLERDINRLDEGNRTETMCAAGAALAGAGIMISARLRRRMVLKRAAQIMIDALGGVRTVCLTASGCHGECRRQRRENQARRQQQCQRTFDEKIMHLAPDSSRYRFPAKSPGQGRRRTGVRSPLDTQWRGIFASDLLFRYHGLDQLICRPAGAASPQTGPVDQEGP